MRYVRRMTFAPLLRYAGLLLTALCVPAGAADLRQTIQAVKPSIVGVGSMLPTRSPAVLFVATGWVTGDGLSVITNAHNLATILDSENKEVLGIVIGSGTNVQFRPATLAGIDREHDLAHLRLAGTALPALTLGDDSSLSEGQSLAFTGFPLGMVLGMQPVTHRAMLSAITPLVLPAANSRKLDGRTIAQLSRTPFSVFQLDGTALPGNSGSPVYDPDTGRVVAVLNKVLVQGLKESAITHPSGITYAIPVRYVRQLLQQSTVAK